MKNVTKKVHNFGVSLVQEGDGYPFSNGLKFFEEAVFKADIFLDITTPLSRTMCLQFKGPLRSQVQER